MIRAMNYSKISSEKLVYSSRPYPYTNTVRTSLRGIQRPWQRPSPGCQKRGTYYPPPSMLETLEEILFATMQTIGYTSLGKGEKINLDSSKAERDYKKKS